MSNELCFNCSTPLAECEWMSKGEPVPGWTAKKRTVKIGETYRIRGCPKFTPPTTGLENVRLARCAVCGTPFWQRVGAGRRQLYCSNGCCVKAYLKRRNK